MSKTEAISGQPSAISEGDGATGVSIQLGDGPKVEFGSLDEFAAATGRIIASKLRGKRGQGSNEQAAPPDEDEGEGADQGARDGATEPEFELLQVPPYWTWLRRRRDNVLFWSPWRNSFALEAGLCFHEAAR